MKQFLAPKVLIYGKYTIYEEYLNDMSNTLADDPVIASPNLGRTSPIKRFFRVLISYIIGLSLFGYYSLAGSLAEMGPRSQGYHNAEIVWMIQHYLPLPSEVELQQFAMLHRWIFTPLNLYYAFAHFPATFLFIVWVAVTRKSQWPRVASALTLMTLMCLTIDALFPVAPPRLYTPLSMVDALARFGPDVYGNAAVASVADQYGAMPSVHFGWSVFVAWGIISLYPRLKILRWLALIHPLTTLSAVILTANHYWSDCIVAALLIPAAIWLADCWMRYTSPTLRQRAKKPALIAAVPFCIFGLLCITRVFV